jgi:hypothetical protein
MRALPTISVLIILACCKSSNEKTAEQHMTLLPDSTVIKTAQDAFIFGLPLVLMDITRKQMTDASHPEGAPENTFRHRSKFPDATFRDVVRPNADTYYSTAFLNLTTEPMVLSLPDTRGRYYMMPLLDAYSNVFASPGTRTTGNKVGNYVIVGPQWVGQLPADMQQIKAPTNNVWIIGRTQVNSKLDGEQVVSPLQQHYVLTPLSAFGTKTITPVVKNDPNIPKGNPNDVVINMPVEKFFNYMNQLMTINPPAREDKSAVERFATIGIAPGQRFDLSKFNSRVQEVLRKIPEETLTGLKKKMGDRGKLVNGWNPITEKQGAYGTDYKQRALIAVAGLGANLPEDAVYPSTSSDAEGNPLDGANKYQLHFDKEQTPPANAFWSITMYDPSGFFVPNDLDRFAIGDRSNLKINADGSTDIFIQHSSPGKEKETNWLPAPEGPFHLVLRVYWPKDEMINGTWKPGAVKKVN